MSAPSYSQRSRRDRSARRLAATLVVLAAALIPVAPAAGAAGATTPCRFVLGFKALRDRIPDVVGDCLEDEHHVPESHATLQRTTRGLLVWRLSDSATAFTDGYRTWIEGPAGLQLRLNTERFDWERDPVATPEPATQAVFLGDSHFRLWDVESAFAPARVVNRGVSGETSEQILRRFAGDVVAARPRCVVIVAGTNDVLRGVPPSDTRANLGSMLVQARQHDIVAYVATIPPIRAGSQVSAESVDERNRRIRDLDEWLRGSAAGYGATVVDFYAALADGAGELCADCASADGIHLSGAGYGRLARLLKPLLLGGRP